MKNKHFVLFTRPVSAIDKGLESLTADLNCKGELSGN